MLLVYLFQVYNFEVIIMNCTFFGNRDIRVDKIEAHLWQLLNDLITIYNVNTFFVGNEGNFDGIVQKQLKKLKQIYPDINYSIALAYLPTTKKELDIMDYNNTFIPEGVEIAPKRFAIDRRNRWLIKNSDFVITCVLKTTGGAAKYKDLAMIKGKKIIEISHFL